MAKPTRLCRLSNQGGFCKRGWVPGRATWPRTHKTVAPRGALPASKVKGVIRRGGRRGAPGRGVGRKVGGPEGKSRDQDQKQMDFLNPLQ